MSLGSPSAMHWIFLSLLVFAPPAHSSPRLDQDRLKALVQQLASSVREERDRAEDALRSAGPQILDRLPREGSSPEASRALERVRLDLERSATQQAAAASTVSIHGLLSP